MVSEGGQGPEFSRTVDVLTLNPEVYACQNQGREKNLTSVLEAHKKGNPDFWAGLKDKSVLVRPNIVDTDRPQGCSRPEALECTLRQLAAAGVSKIDIGDLSSADFYKAHPEAKPQLLYTDVVNKLKAEYPKVAFSLIDLKSLDRNILKTTGLPIVDTAKYTALVDLALPKEHGQYYFSCGAKHLMGLVEPNARPGYFHQNPTQEDIQGILANRSLMNEIRGRLTASDPTMQNLEYNALVILAAGEKYDPDNMKRMAKFIQETVNSLDQKGTKILTVVDGFETLTGQEHSGTLQETNFALVGLNPVAVDLIAARRIGLLEQTGYLTELSKLIQPKSIGDQLPAANPYKLKRVPKDIKLSPDGRSFSYAAAVKRV